MTQTINENAEILAANGQEPSAPNVIEALRRVMRDLPAIGKDQRASQQQGGYAYRGIEQITKEAQRLFARHGVVFTPRISAWSVREIEVNSKPWTDDRMEVTYRVYGPGGIEDFIDVGPIPAIGRDNSDKGSNKCMTQAYKYALIQTFCIADAKDDADGTTHEADPRRFDQASKYQDVRVPDEERSQAGNSRRGPRVLDGWSDYDEQQAAHNAYKERGLALPEPQREAIKAWTREQGYGWPMTWAELEAVNLRLDQIVGAGEPGASQPTGDTDAVPSPQAASGDSPAPGETSALGGDAETDGGRLLGEVEPDPVPHGIELWSKSDLLDEAREIGLDVTDSWTKPRLATAIRAWNQAYRPDYEENEEGRPF